MTIVVLILLIYVVIIIIIIIIIIKIIIKCQAKYLNFTRNVKDGCCVYEKLTLSLSV